MFGVAKRMNAGKTTWVNLNAKSGGLVESRATGEKDATTGKEVYAKVVHEGLPGVLVQRLFLTKDTFEGQPRDVINVSVRNAAGEQAVIKAGINQLSIKMLGMLNAMDLTKPIDIVAGKFEAGSDTKLRDTVEGSPTFGQYVIEAKRDQDEPFLTFDQDGFPNPKKPGRVTPDFGGAGKQPPKVEKIPQVNPRTQAPVMDPKTGKQAVFVDASERDAFLIDFATKIAAKIEAAAKQQPPAPTAPVEPVEPSHDDDAVDAADLVTGGDRPDHG